jgi:hypothetical protein
MKEQLNPLNIFLNRWVDSHANIFENDLNKSSAFILKFNSLLKSKDFSGLNELVDSIDCDDVVELKDFISELKLVTTDYVKDFVTPVINDMLLNILSIGLENDCVKKVNKPISYEECISISEALRLKENKFVFLISSNISVKGKITGKVRDNKIKIDLINYYTPIRANSDNFVLYFGQGTSKAKCAKSLSADFYSYYLEDGVKQYLLLSLEPIKTQRVFVKGCVVQVSDKMIVGESFQLPSNLNVIFVNSFEEEKRTYSEQEIRDIVGTPSYDELKKMYLGVFSHPDWLEKLLLIWNFSGTVEGYPLHLSIVGPPKTGKTMSTITPFWTVIPDLKQNGQSTFKGLIPSFGGGKSNSFNEGALLRADRICYLDEFLTPVCAGGHNYNDTYVLFGKLNSILEWNMGDVSSGYGKSIAIANPTMQLLACSNFQLGLTDLVQAASRLNTAGMSRIFWYCQNQENIDFINKNSSKVMSVPVEKRLPVYDGKAVALYDFFKMKENRVELDYGWVSIKHKRYASLIPDGLIDVYSRYDHHLACLVDGVSKLRWLIGDKNDFRVADTQDYIEAEHIFSIVISSWITDKSDLFKLPKNARVKHLTSKERAVYEHISSFGGIMIDELNAMFNFCDVQIQELVRLELVYVFDKKHYAFWHSIVKEKVLGVGKVGQNNIPEWA